MILLCPFTATPGESTLWLKYKKYRNQFVFIYNKADHCDSEEQRVENVIGMSELLGAKQITRTITDDLKEGQQTQVQACFSTGFPKRVPDSFVEINNL